MAINKTRLNIIYSFFNNATAAAVNMAVKYIRNKTASKTEYHAINFGCFCMLMKLVAMMNTTINTRFINANPDKTVFTEVPLLFYEYSCSKILLTL